MYYRSLTFYYLSIFLLVGLMASPLRVYAQATELDRQSQDTSIFNGLVEPVSMQAVAPIIKAIPDSIQIVGLGESSHFTKQYYDYKQAIIAAIHTLDSDHSQLVDIQHFTTKVIDAFA